MIANKYILIDIINKGSFGIVYKAENIITKDYVAIKFENKNNPIKSLKNEAKIYQYLGKLDGFPKLKIFGTIDKVNYLVIDLLGKSLCNIVSYYKTLSLKTVLIIGIQIIKRIQTLHEKCLIHRDIKPSNFIFGIGNNTNKLFLVDFGFTKRYDYDGVHIVETNIKNIIGSPNFVSLNVHNYIEPSRRDDIESCIYIILNMFMGRLEWFHSTNIDEIALLKKKIMNTEKVPLFIKKMLYYIKSIGFSETPDYDYLIRLMQKEFDYNDFINNNTFEWSETNN
jgi:serine/threonine protein kinase